MVNRYANLIFESGSGYRLISESVSPNVVKIDMGSIFITGKQAVLQTVPLKVDCRKFAY